MKHLRAYYESAFANEYYPVALDAYNKITNLVVNNPSVLIPFRTVEKSFIKGNPPIALRGFALDDEGFEKSFPKVTITFFAQADLKKIGVYGYLSYFRPNLLGIGVLRGASLACCVPTREKRLTRDAIARLFKSGGVDRKDINGGFKHTFIHEFTHYLQTRKIIYVQNPFETGYTQVRMEKEAWMVMALSEFLEHQTKAVLKKCAENYEVFHDTFIAYVIERDANGLRLFEFWANLSNAQKEQFLREAFVILKQRVHGSVGV